jgi:hypothetical protein
MNNLKEDGFKTSSFFTFFKLLMMKSGLTFLIILGILLYSCTKDNTIDPKPVNAVIESVLINDNLVPGNNKIINITPDSVIIQINFSAEINTDKTDSQKCYIGNGIGADYTIIPSSNRKQLILSVNPKLKFSTTYKLYLLDGEYLGIHLIDTYNYTFVTSIDETPKFPLITDDELLTLVQKQTFKYYWDYAHPSCGLSRERFGSGDIVTIGGSGFGIMALMVGAERGFITRPELMARMDKILNFLETCDRFHGAWPHWIDGSTGKVIPFGSNDNGADLVETSFMIQGLLAVRQYMDSGNPTESGLMTRITALWEGVEWDWFTRGGNTLYWHWSPDKGWIMNMPIRGVNETLICYVLGIASPTHPIPAICYKQGYMQNGSVVNGKFFYGYKLDIGSDLGGPLFFAHYSFLGLDPRNLSDQYVNYQEQNTNMTLINRAYCIANPKNFAGYGENSWGLTASDEPGGYSAHSPTNDNGVITPTAAISSLPYTPSESMAALKYFYYILGDKLWGTYGFYDAFDISQGWWASSYLSIDQGPIIVMIENYRTQLVWNKFMSNLEIQNALTSMGFTY